MDHESDRIFRTDDTALLDSIGASRITTLVPAGPDMDSFAGYARYSTSKQNFTSIERQIEVIEAYAAVTGKRMYKMYIDEAVTGATTVGRTGLEEMLRDAEAGKFGGLGLEHVDRLARDLGIAATVYKKLVRLGVSVHLPGRGALTLTELAIQALMGDEGRTSLCVRTQHGLKKMAREGRFPTGPCYGYVKVPGQPGVCAKDPAAAAVILRIFQMRADGISYRAICVAVHADGVRTPAGKPLKPLDIKRLLKNERYRGILVFNRHAGTTDYETRKRSVRLRPRSEWIVTEVPSARIVDQDLWDRAHAVSARRATPGRHRADERVSYLLAGRVACPGCGNTMYPKKAGARPPGWICSDATGSGACDHHGQYSVIGLDKLVLHLLAGELDRPGYVDAYVQAYDEERRRADMEHRDVRAKRQRKVDELQRKWDAMFDQAITRDFDSARVAVRRRSIEEDLAKAERELASTPACVVPTLVDTGKLTALRKAIETAPFYGSIRSLDVAGLRVAATIREVVKRVDIKPYGPGRFEAKVTLSLAALTDGGETAAGRPDGTRVLTGSCQLARGGHRLSRLGIDHDARYAAGDVLLTDDDWQAVRHLLPAVAGTRLGKPDHDPRNGVEAMLLVLLTGTAWKHLPKALGGYLSLSYRAARIFRTEEWAAFAAALAARDPQRFGEIPNLSRPYVEWAHVWLTQGYKEKSRPSK